MVPGLRFRSRDHESRYADFVSESTYRGTRSPDFAPDPGIMSRGTRTSSQSPRIAERGPRTLLPFRDHESRYADFVSESTYHGTQSPDFDSDPGTTSRGTRTSSQSPRIAERGPRTLLPFRDHETGYAYFVSESAYRGTRSPDFDSDPGTTSRGTRTSSQSSRIAERGPRTLIPIPGPRVAVRVLRLRVHVSRNAVPGL
jgi:hypothetical protein